MVPVPVSHATDIRIISDLFAFDMWNAYMTIEKLVGYATSGSLMSHDKVSKILPQSASFSWQTVKPQRPQLVFGRPITV